MATVASLNVNLTAGTAQFGAAMGKASKTVQSFAARAQSAQASLGGLARKFAGLATAALSFAAVKNTLGGALDRIDDVGKLSDRLGLTTEALASLQHGAALAGLETGELHLGLQRMLLFLAKKHPGLAPDAGLALVADQLAAISDPAKRAALAVEIFGRSGQKLIPLLAGGAAGLAEMQAEAEKLGLTFSRIDAARIEEANDAWTRVGAAIKGAANQVVIALAPALEGLAVTVQGIIRFMTEWGRVLAAIVVGVAAYRLALKTLTAATRAWAIAQAIAMGTAGPAAWGRLAAGAAAAAAAIVIVNLEFDKLEANAAAAEARQEELTKATLANAEAEMKFAAAMEHGNALRKERTKELDLFQRKMRMEMEATILFNRQLGRGKHTPAERAVGADLLAKRLDFVAARGRAAAALAKEAAQPAARMAFAAPEASLRGSQEALSDAARQRFRGMFGGEAIRNPQQRVEQKLDQQIKLQERQAELQKDVARAVREVGDKLAGPAEIF